MYLIIPRPLSGHSLPTLEDPPISKELVDWLLDLILSDKRLRYGLLCYGRVPKDSLSGRTGNPSLLKDEQI